MESGLGEAFIGVITSSREIINQRQIHLYSSMLELLRQTCKTVGTNANKMDKDDLARFWLKDILPLVFEKDEKIQKNTLDAFEQFMSTFDAELFHASKIWPELKKIMIDNYAVKVGELRNIQNKYWHRIWRLLVGLLNRDLLKSANIINLFLAIVEKGFRSVAPRVRSESFSCWNYLIHIFHRYGELKSPKRVKLVCIPLKTSSSRNLQPKTAAVKMHVWWYLLSCLGKDMVECMSMAVEPFFTFCLNAIEQLFTASELPLICLTTLVSADMNKELLEEHNLEYLCMPSPLLAPNIMEKYADLLTSTMLKALQHVIDNQVMEVKLKEILQEHLIVFLITVMRVSTAHLKEICSKLFSLLEKDIHLYEFALNNMACRPHILQTQNPSNESEILQVMVTLCMSANKIASETVVTYFLQHMFKIDHLCSKKNDVKCINGIASAVMQMLDIEDKANIDIKMQIWRNLVNDMITIFKSQKYQATKDLYRLILWPLETKCQQPIDGESYELVDANFEETWLLLFNSRSSLTGYNKFLINAGQCLTAGLVANGKNEHLVNMFTTYAQAVLEIVADKITYRRNLLTHLTAINSVDNISQPVVVMSLKISTDIIGILKPNEINALFEDIKTLLERILKNLKKGTYSRESVDHWKGVILNKMRFSPDKQLLSQIKQLLKDDPFIIIPTVWSLNPDKLTERQIERISEKTDISMLYDSANKNVEKSPLQPWSPKQVVIMRTPGADIAIEPSSSSDDCREVELTETLPSTIVETPCLDLAILELNVEKPAINKTTKNHIQLDAAGKENRHANDKDISISPDVIMSSGISQELQPNQQFALESELQLSSCGESSKATNELSANIVNKNECSPKKVIENFVLTSPPNRKSTNNSRSPTLRPKSTGHMTGRGAQLINMIRNKSLDVSQRPSSPQASFTTMSSNTRLECSSPKRSITTTLREQGTPSTPTKDLLTFSKRLPSPTASPSVSILKRRVGQRDIDESDMLDTPANKRKRVSFHDPPVSITKEYFREDGEIKPKRCLIMDKNMNGLNSPKSISRRRNSCTEVDRLQINGAGVKSNMNNLFIPVNRLSLNVNGLMPTKVMSAEVPLKESAMTPLAALNLAVEQLPMNVVLEKCLSGKNLTLNCAHTYAKGVSRHMSADANIKTKVLEKLSEDHSKETLEYALRENLTSTVCETLPFNSIAEHVCHKMQTDEVCRNDMLGQLKNMLKNNVAFDTFEYTKCIIEDSCFTDCQIVDLMSILVQKRSTIINN